MASSSEDPGKPKVTRNATLNSADSSPRVQIFNVVATYHIKTKRRSWQRMHDSFTLRREATIEEENDRGTLAEQSACSVILVDSKYIL